MASSPSSATEQMATTFGTGCGASPMSVDHHDAALLLQHGGALDLGHQAFHVHLNLALDLDHHSLNRNTHLVDLDAALAHVQSDRLHGLFVDRSQVDLGGLVAHLQLRGIVPHVQGEAAIALVDGDGLVARHGFRALSLYGVGFVVVDVLGAVVALPVGFVVFDLDGLVLLGVEGNEFASLLVLEAQLVVVGGGSALGTAALDATLGHVRRQRIRGHGGGVVDAAHDERPVDVAIHEIHHHFLADAGNVNGAPLLAGPERGHADPAGALLVVFALAVPMELHLDAAVL